MCTTRGLGVGRVTPLPYVSVLQVAAAGMLLATQLCCFVHYGPVDAVLCCLPDDRSASSTALALASAACDLSRLGRELEQQQKAVQQKLADSQALATSLERQAAEANLTVGEVVTYFGQVYNVACFVAADRERYDSCNGQQAVASCTRCSVCSDVKH